MLPKPDPKCPVNVLSGCTKRFAFDPPKVSRATKRKLKRFTELFTKQLIDTGQLAVPAAGDFIGFEEWLALTDYSGKRKEQIRTALYEEGQDTQVFKRFLVDTHVKDEFYEVPKPLRLINARNDYAKAVLGPIIKVIEKRVCKLKWFIKYIPVSQRPAVLQEVLEAPGMHYACTDYTSFEAQFVPSVMRILERPLYKRMSKNHPDHGAFMRIFDSVLCGTNQMNVCKMFKATVPGVRMSGEMDTSLANGWCNLVLFMYVLWDKGVRLEDLVSVRGFVEGDDGLFALPRKLLPTEADYEELGFRIKIIIVKELNLASFCGNIFAPGDNIVVTDPIKMLSKLGWCSRKYLKAGQAIQMALLRAKALSIVHQYNGCPILSTAGRRLVELTRKVRFRKNFLQNAFNQYERQWIREDLPAELIPSEETRYIVEDLYGITIAQQIEIEERLKVSDFGSFDLGIASPWGENYERYVDCVEELSMRDIALTLFELRDHYLKSGNTSLKWSIQDL